MTEPTYPPITLSPETESAIATAMRHGATIRAFRSGGGLRVVRIERGAELIGYGEHFDVATAIDHAAEDYLAGGRPYAEVYGPKGKYPHYLTGSSDSGSDIDSLICQGNTFLAKAVDGACEASLTVYAQQKHPQDMIDRVRKTGETESYTSERGVTYEVKGYNDGGVSIAATSLPPGMPRHRNFTWYATKTGRGRSLTAAFAAAMSAPEIEDTTR